MMVSGGRIFPGRGNNQCTGCPMRMFLVCSQNSKVVSMAEASERVGEWYQRRPEGQLRARGYEVLGFHVRTLTFTKVQCGKNVGFHVFT